MTVHEDDPPPAEKEAREVAELRERMEESEEFVPASIREYVQRTLAFGVAQTRSEYRPLARRNWHLIQRWGQRTFALMAATFIALLVLGTLSVSGSQEAAEAGRQARGAAHTARGSAAVAKKFSLENAKRIKEGAAQRSYGLRQACREANEHHVEAAREIGALLARAPRDPRQSPAQQRALGAVFVQAIAPKYDCKKRVQKFLTEGRSVRHAHRHR